MGRFDGAIRLGELKPCRHASTVSPAPLVRRFGENAFKGAMQVRAAVTVLGLYDAPEEHGVPEVPPSN